MQDGVPLHWKDQYVFHVGAERSLTESTTIRAGFAHANSPVPSSTLTPLTPSAPKPARTSLKARSSPANTITAPSTSAHNR
jgi:hypothetical protein